jgi:hypothetical protein
MLEGGPAELLYAKLSLFSLSLSLSLCQGTGGEPQGSLRPLLCYFLSVKGLLLQGCSGSLLNTMAQFFIAHDPDAVCRGLEVMLKSVLLIKEEEGARGLGPFRSQLVGTGLLFLLTQKG